MRSTSTRMRETVGRAAALLTALAASAVLTACTSQPPPSGHLPVVEFSAEGPEGAAASGSYTLVGDLPARSATTFDELPFSARVPAAPSTIAPNMTVSVVDVPPGSRVTCRITLDGEVLVERTAEVPGPDVECLAPATPTD